MNIGDYVRTNKGTIDKITEDNIIDYKISLLYEGEKVDNWSENIIDLIEVGDIIKYHPMQNGYVKTNILHKEKKMVEN